MSTRKRRIAAILLTLAAAYFLVAPFVVPPILERYAQHALGDTVRMSSSWGAFNPLTLSLTQHDFRLETAAGRPLLELPRVTLNSSLTDIWSGSATVQARSVTGSVRFIGFRADLELTSAPLASSAGLLGGSGLNLEGGTVSGRLTLETDQGLQAAGDLQLSQAQMTGPAAAPAVRFGSAAIEGLYYDFSNGQLTARRVVVNGLAASLVRPAAVPAGETGETGEGGDGIAITVDSILLFDAAGTFTDQVRAAPPVALSAINGRISDFRLDDGLAFGFTAEGQVAEASPIRAEGRLAQATTLDAALVLTADRVPHQLVAPYTLALFGRAPAGGSLYLSLDYKVEADHVTGSNSLVFDQWRWGDLDPAFEGEPAPVRRAFDILEGKGGRVRMDIPVEGDLDDPEFQLDATVRRATRRFVGDIVGAPFKLLGAIIPGGGKDELDLERIRFEPGSTTIAPLDRAKLDALAAALNERPRLRLAIRGFAAPEMDGTSADLAALAAARAEAIHDFLVAAGIASDRLLVPTDPDGDALRANRPQVRLEVIRR